MFSLYFWFVVFAVLYPFPKIRDEVPGNFKATAEYAVTRMGYGRFVPTKHTRPSEGRRAYAWNFGSLVCLADESTHQLARLSVQKQGQRSALSLPFTLLLI
jgi:hypothetical protein